MLRIPLCFVGVLLLISIGMTKGEDTNKSADQRTHHMQAIIDKVDEQNGTVSVKVTDKNGKQKEKTLHLSKNAKYLNSMGKDAKLDTFKSGDNVCMSQQGDQVTELKKHAEAKITKVDAKGGTITVKMADKDGKEVEKTFRLVEDSEYVDSSGRVAVLDVFQSGDDILFVESEGTITAMKKAENKQATTASKSDSDKKPNTK